MSSSWKLVSKLPEFLLVGKTTTIARGSCNPRLFVSSTRPLQDKSVEEKEEAYKHVQEAADAWSDTATTVKNAAQDISKGAKAATKTVTGAMNTVTDKAKEAAKESLGKKAKEIIKDKFLDK